MVFRIMIIKQVKEYGSKTKRQRIDLAKSDGFTPGEDVVLIPKEQYDSIKQDILELQQQITDKDSELKIAYEQINIASEVSNNLKKQFEDLRNQKINLQQVVKDALTPIDEHYQKELKKKDKQIEQLEIKYNSLLGKAHKNNLELMGLNIFEMGLFHKHKKLIMDFDQELTIVATDPEVVTTDVKKLRGNENEK